MAYTVALILYSFTFGFLVTTLYSTKTHRFHLLAKTLNSAGFVLVALFFTLESNKLGAPFAPFAITALVLCMIGDVLLAATPCKAGTRWFFSGVLIFAVAHVVFYLGIARLISFSLLDFIFPMVFVLFVNITIRRKQLDVGNMGVIIAIYCFLVALLCSKAVSLLLVIGSAAGTVMVALGAGLFCLSDFILLFVYFSANSIQILKFLNLLSYYSGMLLLAFSIPLI